jgi:hypothetical protein
MMPPDALKTLQQVNASLRSALIHLHPEQRHCSTIQPQDFSDLLTEILRAAEFSLPAAPAEVDVATQHESLEFRGNLEELKCLLPQLHGNLLAEKSRLESAQAHIAAAAAWARASTKTL